MPELPGGKGGHVSGAVCLPPGTGPCWARWPLTCTASAPCCCIALRPAWSDGGAGRQAFVPRASADNHPNLAQTSSGFPSPSGKFGARTGPRGAAAPRAPPLLAGCSAFERVGKQALPARRPRACQLPDSPARQGRCSSARRSARAGAQGAQPGAGAPLPAATSVAVGLGSQRPHQRLPALRAGHYPHHHHHHRLDLDPTGNGAPFGAPFGAPYSAPYGDGAGEAGPPLPLKLPPEHLFTCTVGRNRSQARCARPRRRAGTLRPPGRPHADEPHSAAWRRYVRSVAHCLANSVCLAACAKALDMRAWRPAGRAVRRYFLTGSSEVGTLLAQLAESPQAGGPRAA